MGTEAKIIIKRKRTRIKISKQVKDASTLGEESYSDANEYFGTTNHHGSRPGHSTATALIQMYDSWVEEVDDGNLVGVMMVDLSAAFDMVDHDILLKKLQLFGLDDMALSWVKSYLSGRCQSVYVDGCLSPPLDIACGVP